MENEKANTVDRETSLPLESEEQELHEKSQKGNHQEKSAESETQEYKSESAQQLHEYSVNESQMAYSIDEKFPRMPDHIKEAKNEEENTQKVNRDNEAESAIESREADLDFTEDSFSPEIGDD